MNWDGWASATTPGCLNPKQADRPWCAEDEAMAAEILAEVLADEGGEAR